MNFKKIKYEIEKERVAQPAIKILSYWAGFCFLAIITIKTIIRPRHFNFIEGITFLQGVLPNFFAGAGFFVFPFIYYKAFCGTKYLMSKRIFISFLFSFLGLTLWEFIQFFMGFPIDFYDILMTFFGNLSSVFIVKLLRLK